MGLNFRGSGSDCLGCRRGSRRPQRGFDHGVFEGRGLPHGRHGTGARHAEPGSGRGARGRRRGGRRRRLRRLQPGGPHIHPPRQGCAAPRGRSARRPARTALATAVAGREATRAPERAAPPTEASNRRKRAANASSSPSQKSRRASSSKRQTEHLDTCWTSRACPTRPSSRRGGPDRRAPPGEDPARSRGHLEQLHQGSVRLNPLLQGFLREPDAASALC